MNNKTTIAINGFGRIGRAIYRAVKTTSLFKNLDVIAINDLTDKKTLEHLLQYDSVYGKSNMNLDDINFFQEPDPEKLPWQNIDAIIESTGRFTDYESAAKHTAKKIIISAPSKSPKTRHFIYGVNHTEYRGERIISAGSCTTVALSHTLKQLNEAFGVEKALATTIHSYTSTQRILDAPHKDMRRARAAALSVIPTTTGAAKTVEKVLPELKGKIDAVAVRVPTPVVSLIDLVAMIKKSASAEEINQCFEHTSNRPLVSIDYRLDSRPAIIDTEFTRTQDNLVKVLAWYDNEYGYATQLVRLLGYITNL